MGSVSRPQSTASQRRSTSSPTSEPPMQSRPSSSAYLRATEKSSHWMASAVAVDPSAMRNGMGEGPVASHLVHGVDRVGQREAATGRHVVLDHGQDQGRRPHLEEGGDLGQVGVAHDHVQPSVTMGIGMRLVAGVHDGTLEGGLEPHLLLEELGPLGELKVDVVAVVGGCLAAHLAGTGEDLTGHEVRSDPAYHSSEGRGPIHEVVLVGAVRVALAVRIVLVDDEAAAIMGSAGPRLPSSE